MGFFKSLKGDAKSGADDLSTNQTYNSANHDDLTTKAEGRRLFGNSSSRNPFSSSNPQPQSSDANGRPPSGPPPSGKQAELYSPPTGPPPSQIHDEPPAYHDWTSVPDTSLLPPPPAAPQDFSPANNASDESAEAAKAWCAHFPPYTPNNTQQHAQAYARAQAGDIALQRPETFAKAAEISKLTTGTFSIKTRKGQRDSIVLTDIPSYFALADSPLMTERGKTIYFELRILHILDADAIAAIGFAAKPYPPWRLPGWNRASIGVHSDDGHRFMCDDAGGQEFVRPFALGDVVGLGMRVLAQESELGRGRAKTKVFFTRNGREEGSWDVDEERDAESEGVEGLSGEGDLYAAVGVSGGVEVEVRFRGEDWLYKMV